MTPGDIGWAKEVYHSEVTVDNNVYDPTVISRIVARDKNEKKKNSRPENKELIASIRQYDGEDSFFMQE